MSVQMVGYVGTTIKSPELFTVNEELPKGITQAELEAGIDEGIYTLKDLSDYTFEGDLRKSVGSTSKYDLDIDVTDNRVTFKVPVSETSTWDNCAHYRYFDLRRTSISTGEVDIWLTGRIKVMPTITRED